MTEYRFNQVFINRDENEGPGNYTISGLPEDKTAMKTDNYVRFRASWLKVNGIGFSTKHAEFSQHGEVITVKQETENGAAYIEW